MSSEPTSSPGIDRRRLLQGAAAAGALTAVGVPAYLAFSSRQPDLVRKENARPGTRDWLITNARIEPASRWRSPWIEGYCSRTSLRAGERLAVMVSTNPPSRFVLDVYRMGWYGGAGGRQVAHHGPFEGAVQPDPPVGPERLRECRWEPAVEFEIPSDWPSGIYLGKLTAAREGLQSYVIFIVRDDRECDVLVQASEHTWAAYNRWPDQWSLYDDGKKVWYWGPGVRVSWNRPYGKYCQLLDAPLSLGSGEFLLWEFPLVHWLEKQGYDVSYTGNGDTHFDAAGLRRARLWISVGHDEYWTIEMHDNVKAAIAGGLNVAFLSGNTCYGMVDLHPDHAGVPGRALRRIGQFGPLEPPVVKGFPEMAGLRRGPDEALLIGARTCDPLTGTAAWMCVNDKHWIFAGSGMHDGDRVPGLVGWEFHGKPAPIPGLEVVAQGFIRRSGGAPSYAATVYPGPHGNFVFNGATCWWTDALSEPPGYVRPVYGQKTHLAGPDPRIQRITANLVTRAGGLPRRICRLPTDVRP